MWIEITPGVFGRVEEIVNLNDLKKSKTDLENQIVVKNQELSSLALKINSQQDEQIKTLLDVSLEEAVAPVVLLQNDLDALNGKIQEIEGK